MTHEASDHTEVILTTCSGSTNTVVFDKPHYRLNVADANTAAAVLDKVAQQGYPMSHYRGRDSKGWFRGFRPTDHLIMVTVNRRSSTHEIALIKKTSYPCQHVADPGSPLPRLSSVGTTEITTINLPE